MVYRWRGLATLAGCLVLGAPGAALAQCGQGSGGTVAEGAVVGGILGALVGNAQGKKHRGANTAHGAIAGGVAGAAVGCWVGHQQSVAVSQEQVLRMNTAELNQAAANLEAYNAQLAQEVVGAQQTNAQLQAEYNRRAAGYNQLRSQAQTQSASAQGRLQDIDNSIRNLDGALNKAARGPRDRYDAMMRQRQALEQARSQLIEISNLLA
jgi:hypothetical protein